MEFILQGYGILWDMDGVLVNTGDAHFISWQKTFEEIGEEFSYNFFQTTFGMNNTGILRKLYGEYISDEQIKNIGERKEYLFRESIKGNIQILPGVLEWLEKFKALGTKQAIASSSPPDNITAIVSEVRIEPYFDALVSGFDMPGKPNPDVFLEAAKDISITPQKCLVIEDAIAGVDGAKNAGMKCVAVTTTNPANVLSNANHVFSSLEEMKLEHIQLLFF